MAYRAGDFWRIDDRSGFKVRASQTALQWDGLMVRRSEFEERHPQDFVRGRKDRQSVPDPRPESANTFIGPVITTLTSDVAAGNNTIVVASITGFSVLRTDGTYAPTFVQTNDGQMVLCRLKNLDTGTTIILEPYAGSSFALPAAASAGNIVINYNDLNAPSY